MNRVHRGLHAAVAIERVAGVGVDVEARKFAARDIHANAVALREDVRRGIQANGHLVDRAWLHQLFGLEAVAKASAEDAVADVEVEPARKIRARWIDVEQL